MGSQRGLVAQMIAGEGHGRASQAQHAVPELHQAELGKDRK